MKADEKQISGDHYRTVPGGIQHWTYCIRAEVPNLEYAASKYVTRWRKKGGLTDLKKALHYMEKRLESFEWGVGATQGGKKIDIMFGEFIRDNEIPEQEASLLDVMMHWSDRTQLVLVINFMKKFIAAEENAEEICDYNPNQDR